MTYSIGSQERRGAVWRTRADSNERQRVADDVIHPDGFHAGVVRELPELHVPVLLEDQQ